MSVTDEVLKANENYTGTFNLGHLPMRPGTAQSAVSKTLKTLNFEPFCAAARVPEGRVEKQNGSARHLHH